MLTGTMACTKTARAQMTAKSLSFGLPNVLISLVESTSQVEVSLCCASNARSRIDLPNARDLQARPSTLSMRFLERLVLCALWRETITRIRRSSSSTGAQRVNTMRTSQMPTSMYPQSSSVAGSLGLKHYEWVFSVWFDMVCNG